MLVGFSIGSWLNAESVVLRRRLTFGGGLISALILAVAIYDIVDVQSIAAESEGLFRVGSGLYVTAVSGCLGVAGAGLRYFASRI